MALPLAVLLAAAVSLASWRAGQHPRITPGTHQIFRMDSTPGALLEFLVLLILIGAGLLAVAKVPNARRVFAAVAASYAGAVLLVSLLTPKTIVSHGDGYCWDLWCLEIQNVAAAPHGQEILYSANVRLFTDSTNEQRLAADPSGKQFFYVTDDERRHYPIVWTSQPPADSTVKPGESLKGTLTFAAPAAARGLYLTGDVDAPWWVRLYLASDLNPFHRPTLLRLV
jgi:hypothetical protein